MTHLKLWQFPATGYAGADLSDWYPIVGKHRDSDALDRTNFDAALARLQAIAGHDEPMAALRCRWYQEDGEGDVREAVSVMGFSNPFTSWSESIMVHKDADPAVLAEAEAILEDLAAYPVLDEDAFGTLEYDEAHDWWRDMGLKNRMELCREAGVSVFAARRADEIPQDDSGFIFERLRGC